MANEENKAIVWRYLELWHSGDLSIADEVLAPDFVDHTHPGRPPGPESVKQEVMAFRVAFPDAHAHVEQMIAEGDTVAFRFTLRGTFKEKFGSFPPTGKEAVLTGVDFIRIANGKMVELWSTQDTFNWAVQLGAKFEFPTPD